MASHTYIVDRIYRPLVIGGRERPCFTAAYFGDGQIDARWAGMDHPEAGLYVIRAHTTDAQHAMLLEQGDVLALPDDPGATMPLGQVMRAREFLEARGVPGNWITVSMTSRDIVRGVAQLVQLAQRVLGVSRTMPALRAVRDLRPAATLGTRWRDMPPAKRDPIIEAARSKGYSVDVPESRTARAALRTLAAQWGDAPIILGGEVI